MFAVRVQGVVVHTRSLTGSDRHNSFIGDEATVELSRRKQTYTDRET